MLKHRHKANRRGAIAILAALCLIIVIAFLAFSIDFGQLAVAESNLQNAADAAALSAARALPNRELAIAAAIEWAEKNNTGTSGTPLVSTEDIEIGTWDEETALFTVVPEGDNTTLDAVRVTCHRTAERGNSIRLFFAPVIGTNNASVMASAIARRDRTSCGGIIGLLKIYFNDRVSGHFTFTDSYDSGQGEYGSWNASNNGDICTNGVLRLRGNTFINGDAKWWENAATPSVAAWQVSGDFIAFQNQLVFSDINPGNAANQNNNSLLNQSNNGVDLLDNQKFQLGSSEPGPPDSITLPPGTYYFTEMSLFNDSTITLTGPTRIYVEGTIDLRYGNIDNVNEKPIDLQIYPMGNNKFCYLPLFGELHAVIYTTKSYVQVNTPGEDVDLEFFGKILAKRIVFFDVISHIDESVDFDDLEAGKAQHGTSGITLVQ